MQDLKGSIFSENFDTISRIFENSCTFLPQNNIKLINLFKILHTSSKMNFLRWNFFEKIIPKFFNLIYPNMYYLFLFWYFFPKMLSFIGGNHDFVELGPLSLGWDPISKLSLMSITIFFFNFQLWNFVPFCLHSFYYTIIGLCKPGTYIFQKLKLKNLFLPKID